MKLTGKLRRIPVHAEGVKLSGFPYWERTVMWMELWRIPGKRVPKVQVCYTQISQAKGQSCYEMIYHTGILLRYL